MPIAGNVQTPIDTISVCDLYYDQPVNGCTSRAGKVTDDLTQLYENQSYTIGKALVDPGCQEHLFQSIYESYMNETSQSNLSVSGFDGSQQPGRMQGWSHMYFMQTDPAYKDNGQYVQLSYDTVENNKENLFAVSEYFEQGADILFQHHGFCGIRGRDADGNPFKIPCHYSAENRGFEVDFVVAKSKEQAVAVGKRLEKQRSADNAINAHLCRAMTLDDSQLAAAAALVRGNVSIRKDDRYTDANLGSWSSASDDDLKQDVCRVCNISVEEADRVCWSFPAKVDDCDAECSDDLCNSDVQQATTDDDNRTQLIDEYYNAYDGCISGMKDGLNAKHRKMKSLELHQAYGCVGYHPDCKYCTGLKRSLRRRYMRTDPHKETRPGHTWGFDILVWKTESVQGNKYSLIMRDYKTGKFIVRHMRQRSDLTDVMESVIVDNRNDPRFKLPADADYELISVLRCDCAGEQSDMNEAWNAMLKRHRVRCEWGDPTDKRSNGFQEQAVKMIELGAKAIMAQTACPASWWEYCVDQTAEIRNHVPLSMNVTSADGDTVCPIEELSYGRVSRRSCHRYLDHLVLVGTPCHVQQKPEATKGSDNTVINRHKPGIAVKMIGDLPMFLSPFTGKFFRSKGYIKWDAPPGCSAYEFFGCENPSKLPYLGTPAVESPMTPHYVVSLDDVGRFHKQAMPKTVRKPDLKVSGLKPRVTVTDELGYIYEADESGEYRRTTGMLQKLDAANVIEGVGALTDRDKQIARVKYDPESFVHHSIYQAFDGVVYEGVITGVDVDSHTGKTFWSVLYSDNVSGDLWDHELIKYGIDFVDGQAPGLCVVKKSHPRAMENDDERTGDTAAEDQQQNATALSPDDYLQTSDGRILINADKMKAELAEYDGYYTVAGETFKDVCKQTGLDRAQWKAYYKWVHSEFMRGATFLQRNPDDSYSYPGGIGFADPFQKGVKQQPLPTDTKFPLPMGPAWDKIVDSHRVKSNSANEEHVQARYEHRAFFEGMIAALKQSTHAQTEQSENATYDRIASCMKTFAQEDLNPVHMCAPKNLKEAMERENWDDWYHCMLIELKGLEALGVFSDNAYTLKQLREMGITAKPMLASLIFDAKRHGDGSWDKDKSRLVIRGHKWNMRKTFGKDHVYETFAATPDLASTRLMQALMCLYGWTPLAFDIRQAYCNADVGPGEAIPIQFEPELQTFDDKGEPTYRVLKKALYGMNTSCRRYTEMRNEWMLKHFNSDGWQCKQMKSDPSVFTFKNPEGKTAIATVHSDDADLVCEIPQIGIDIAAAFDKRFGVEGAAGIKMTDPSFMLGVQRTTTTQDGVTYHELTQRGCVVELFEEFKDSVPKKATTPMPDGAFLSLYDQTGEKKPVDAAEVKRIKEAGYQHIVGVLLWLCRNVFPEIAQGVSQLCKVMAAPDEEAYNAALHMIRYLYTHRDRGIRYRSDGNLDPLALYDASNKGDHGDSKCSAGYVIMLAGGPISWESKKLAHAGTSSSHNEYMAAFRCAREVHWIREFLIELDLPGNDWSKPIVMLGDNDQATRWINHGMVTTANKSIRMNYHWVRECARDGIVCPRRVPTVNNLSDVFTKTLKDVDMSRLRPGLTGYGPLPQIPDKPPS